MRTCVLRRVSLTAGAKLRAMSQRGKYIGTVTLRQDYQRVAVVSSDRFGYYLLIPKGPDSGRYYLPTDLLLQVQAGGVYPKGVSHETQD